MNKPLPINLIDFNIGVGKGKPLTINGEKRSCPFCNVGTLTDIIDTKDDMIGWYSHYEILEHFSLNKLKSILVRVMKEYKHKKIDLKKEEIEKDFAN